MRLKIILLSILVLLLICPIVQASQEMIFVATDSDGNHHSFYPDSIKLHNDTIVCQTRMDLAKINNGVKYQTISMLINPLKNTYRMLAMTEYGESDEQLRFLTYNLPWETIETDSIADTTVRKVLNYCIQNKLPVKVPPNYPLSDFIFATSTPTGDSLSFSPASIAVSGNQISMKILLEYRTAPDKFNKEIAVIHFLPGENKYRIDCREQTQPAGPKRLMPDIDWSSVEPGSPWDNLLSAVQKYCHKYKAPYVVTPAPPAYSQPAGIILATQSVSGDQYYYDPDTIRNFEDYFSVKVYREYTSLYKGVKHSAATVQFRLSEKKYKLTASELFDESGFRLVTPLPDSAWNDLEPGTDMEIVYNNIITYCGQKNISLNLPANTPPPNAPLTLPDNRILAYTAISGTRFFFVPTTICPNTGCLTAQVITELPVSINDIKYTSALLKIRQSDKKYRLSATNLYNDKDIFLSTTPDFEWENISSGSALSKVVIKILDYCLTNNIQIP